MADRVAEIVTVARVDLADFETKMRRHDQKLDESDRKSKRSGMSRGGAFLTGAVGGFAGGIAATVASQGAGPITGLIGNMFTAALLPVIMELVPVLERLADWLTSQGVSDAVSGAADFVKRNFGVITGGSVPDESVSSWRDVLRVAGEATLTAGAAGAAIGKTQFGTIGALVGGGIGSGVGLAMGLSAGARAFHGVDDRTGQDIYNAAHRGGMTPSTDWFMFNEDRFFDPDVSPQAGMQRRSNGGLGP